MSNNSVFLRLFTAVAFAIALTACSEGTEASTPTTGPGSPTATTHAPPTSGSGAGMDIPPVVDAAGARDQLLQIASTVHYQGPIKETPLLAAWHDAYPDMKVTLFPDQPAKPDTFSMADSFTFDSKSSEAHGYDQILAFAVMDQDGTCAGGAVVVPQTADGKASDAMPSVFAPVDMSSASECTADVAQHVYGTS